MTNKRALELISDIIKHLPGEHDQSSHAGGNKRVGAGKSSNARKSRIKNGTPFGLESYKLSDALYNANWQVVHTMPFGNDVAETVGYRMEIGDDTEGWADVTSTHGKKKFNITYRGSIPSMDTVRKDFKKHFNYYVPPERQELLRIEQRKRGVSNE